MKILMLNNFPSQGAKVYFDNLYKYYSRENDVTYIDYAKFPLVKNEYTCNFFRYFIFPFIAVYYQLRDNYDLVINNQSMIFKIGKNKKCEYKWTLYHPASEDKKNTDLRKITTRIKWAIIETYEKLAVISCENILTLSKFSKKKIEERYPNAKVELLPELIDDTFFNAKIKNYKKKRIIFLPNLYRDDRKGGNFLTSVLISLAPLFRKKKIQILISNRINKSQLKNYNNLKKHCKVKLVNVKSLEELAKYYASSLLVLTPATLEGYGLVPLEVAAAGGRCISAPFPSLGFDNKHVDSNKHKTVVRNIIVLEHDKKLWYNEIKKIVEKI